MVKTNGRVHDGVSIAYVDIFYWVYFTTSSDEISIEGFTHDV
jgi:hypothetical protein